jgi:SAM-dependent methyltransferase
MDERIRRLMPDRIFHLLRDAKKEIQKIFYKGDKVYCVCCGSKFRSFAPFGVHKLPNRMCLECDSLERDRLMWMYLDRKTDLYKKPVKLLHVAPERIFFKKFKSTLTIEYYPVDKFPEPYPAGTKYLDLLDNSLPHESFDVIICNHVFQYIEEDGRAIQAVYNLLKPDGWAILQVPIDWNLTATYEDFTITDPAQREKIFGLREHVRWYGKDYGERLEGVGFSVKQDNFIAEFTPEELTHFGLWKGQPIWYCTKKANQSK